MHGAPRRTTDPLVRHAGECSHRQANYHHRGDRGDAGRQDGAAGVVGPRGRAVRVLPVGSDHVGIGAAREERPSQRRRHRRGDVGQYLPLRDLPSHSCRDQARREGSLTMASHTVSRRDFVVVLTATGSGLLLGCRVGDRAGATTAGAAEPPPAFAPNAFIRIGSDGRVTLIMNQVEMGQGTYTSMPLLLAEELEVGLDQVQLEHAPPNDKLYANPFFGDQETGSPSSARGLYQASPRP